MALTDRSRGPLLPLHTTPEPGLLLAWDVRRVEGWLAQTRLYRAPDGTHRVTTHATQAGTAPSSRPLSDTEALALFKTLRVRMLSCCLAFPDLSSTPDR